MAAANVREVGLEDFRSSVVEESFRRPVVVDFWAAWCGPCRVLGPVLERLAEAFQGDFLLAKVDTEANPELASQFGIRSIPNVKIIKDGRIADEFVGALPEDEIRRILRRHCPSAADRKLEEAMDHVEAGRPQEAREALREALRLDPSHGATLLQLGKMSLESGDAAEADELWSRVPAESPAWEEARTRRRSLEFERVCAEAGGPQACAERAEAEPDDLDARYAHACCLAARHKYRDALEAFLAIVARNREHRDQAARKAMLTVFTLVGERSELSEEYRKRLAMTLY